MEKKQHYIAGIDLGTSNCALSFLSTENKEIKSLPIEQTSGPSHTVHKTTLSSSVLLLEDENPLQKMTPLSWATDKKAKIVVGSWAKEKSSEMPEQVVQSAKSWLCHKSINRLDNFLPWKSSISSNLKISPVTSSSYLLSHLKTALAHYLKNELNEKSDDLQTHFTVTVPASFDEMGKRTSATSTENTRANSVMRPFTVWPTSTNFVCTRPS